MSSRFKLALSALRATLHIFFIVVQLLNCNAGCITFKLAAASISAPDKDAIIMHPSIMLEKCENRRSIIHLSIAWYTCLETLARSPHANDGC